MTNQQTLVRVVLAVVGMSTVEEKLEEWVKSRSVNEDEDRLKRRPSKSIRS